jgi:hypothetical protein
MKIFGRILAAVLALLAFLMTSSRINLLCNRFYCIGQVDTTAVDRMSTTVEPILLTAYLLAIAYFIYRILNSFNDEYAIKVDNDALTQALESATIGDIKLSDILGISFGFAKRYEFKGTLNKLAINISNKSEQHIIYVDWDCSTLTDLEGKARRVTRVLPGMTLDLFQNQVFSTIAPKTTLKENITAEDLLQRKDGKEEYELPGDKTLINPDPAKGPDGLKQKLVRFQKRLPGSELQFSMDLTFRLSGPGRGGSVSQFHVPCKFILTKYPWSVGLPWNPK